MVQATRVIRLAIVSSHPIQYNAPLFYLLSKTPGLRVMVFYSWKGIVEKEDPEFGEKIEWDIPLLAGYEYCFINNISKHPGSHHFSGLNNPSMIAKIKLWEADSVLVYGWAFKTHLAVLRYFYGRIPVFFRGDSTLLNGGGIIRRLSRKIFLTWVYRHVDMAFYPGQRSKDYFLEYGLPPCKISHLVHSIDNNRFSKDADSLELESIKMREDLGIRESSLVLLFAGKLVARKQPEFLFEAVKKLVQSEKLDIHLIFVGVGPLLDKLQVLAKGLDYIHFLGFQNQTKMPLMYRLGDVYVLPSTIETWGLGVNEAMACSRPVLVSDLVGCASDLVKQNLSGDIFLSGNKDSITYFIRKYARHRKSVLDMRISARALIDVWAMDRAAKQLGNYILDSSL